MVLKIFIYLSLTVAASPLFAAPMIVQIGTVEPSAQGRLIQLEDVEKSFLVETYGQLPPSMAPIFGTKIHEMIVSSRGSYVGRRVSILPFHHVHEDGLRNRHAGFEFSSQNKIVNYVLFDPLDQWFKKDAFVIDQSTSESEQFFHRLFYAWGQIPPVQALVKVRNGEQAPRGLLSPRILRPPYLLKPVDEDLNSVVVIYLARRYDEKGELRDFDFGLDHQITDHHGQVIEKTGLHRPQLTVLDPRMQSPLFNRVLPCETALRILKFTEGEIRR